MNSYAILPWLIGTSIAICAVIIPCIIIWSRGKVNKETCEVIHLNLDEKLSTLTNRTEENGKKLDLVATTMVRIETILNGR